MSGKNGDKEAKLKTRYNHTDSVHLLDILFRFAHKLSQKVLQKLQVFASSPFYVEGRTLFLVWLLYL